VAGRACAWLAAGTLLFGCYLQLSRTVPVDSDGAANALQAWDMLHGNLLLRGWRLSDVSFYTTELPQYMLIELARGLTPDVVHVAGAITFTLLVLLAAMLAKGRTRGREAAVRMGIAAGIMLAPQLGSGVYVLMLDPDHVGTRYRCCWSGCCSTGRPGAGTCQWRRRRCWPGRWSPTAWS
jgi:hypothetical protein